MKHQMSQHPKDIKEIGVVPSAVFSAEIDDDGEQEHACYYPDDEQE
jgi:hypothetical protein